MAVVVDSVSFRYGRHDALSDVSATFGRGIHALLGPNGAGKSTLMAVVSSIRRPVRGRVEVCGYQLSDPQDLRRARALIGLLPQRSALPGGMRVADTVAYAAWAGGVRRVAAHEAARVALDRVGLVGLADRRVGRLSGGQRQRVAIAAAIAHGPRVLILDEPTVGLDPAVRVEFRQLLSEIADSCIVLISTHMIEDVAQLSDHVLVLKSGRLVFDGTASELAQVGASEATGQGFASPLELGYTALLSKGTAS